MELISSYIFLKNSYAKQENEVKQKADGTQVLVLGKSLYSYIKKTVPTITKDNSYGMYAAVMPTTSWMQDVIPPCVGETQKLLKSIKVDTSAGMEDSENK